MNGILHASQDRYIGLGMKRILFINPSLRLHSKTKFLPVGIASVMTYLVSQGVKFEFLDIDIDDIEDTDVKLYLERNRYDIVLTGSIVTHYKWMKWLTKPRYYNPKSIIIVEIKLSKVYPHFF